ncbi:MAG: Rrf2 family transcriptional regulator [Armatimonadetes bacterium]|nr:Rrf2 family transcriptional regulator [Armatimonadota bacterium]MDW8028639.1 Rrf2 family transcriptional regulator [Armatimonadota bacterium]
MLYSRTCQYALWALMELAREQSANGKGWVKAEKVAQNLGLPFPMTAKVLQMLVHAHILDSVRGPTGGFRLRLPPEKICLLDVVLAIDGPELFEHCVLGLPSCDEINPCPVHNSWAPIRDQLKELLKKTTLADLLKTWSPQVAKRVAESFRPL